MPSPESESLEQKPVGEMEVLELNASLNDQVAPREMEVVEMNPPSTDPTPETASESVAESLITSEAGTSASAPEALPTEKKEIPGDIATQYAERFGIQKEDLEKIEGFGELSRGQQKMVLENLQQLTIGKIHEEAIDGHKAALAGARENTTILSSKFLGKVWVGVKDSFTKQFDVANREKQLAASIQQGGIDGHRASLEQMVSGMKNLGPEVKETPYGGLEVQYIDTKGMSPELSKIAESFNSEGTKYSQIPYEWSLESASPGQREEFMKAKEAYERARGELMSGWTEGEGERAAAMAKSESMIEMQRFMQTCPDAAEELRSIEDQNAWKAALKSVGTERGAYFALGMVGRTALAGMLGVVAAPVVAAVSGGIRGWKRTGDALLEQDVSQRAGKLEEGSEDADGTRKNMIDATREVPEDAKGYRGSIEKIDGIITKLRGAEDSDRDTGALAEALRRRMDYTKKKISEGKMVFGGAEERLGNQYALMRSLAEAEAILSSQGAADENGDKIAQRLEKMLAKKDEDIADARFKKKIHQAVRAGVIGAGFAGLGAVARDVVGWMNGPSGILSEVRADGVTGTEAAALFHDVQPGESLSKILEHEYPETTNIEVIRALRSMSAGHLKDAGITSGNPDQIFPGDHIDIGKIKAVLDTHPKLTALHGGGEISPEEGVTSSVQPAEPNGWSETVSNPGERNGWSETISNPETQAIDPNSVVDPENWQNPDAQAVIEQYKEAHGGQLPTDGEVSTLLRSYYDKLADEDWKANSEPASPEEVAALDAYDAARIAKTTTEQDVAGAGGGEKSLKELLEESQGNKAVATDEPAISEEAIRNELPPNYQPPGSLEAGESLGERERAVSFLQKLSKAHAPENITNAAQQRIWSEKAAKYMIQQYAAEEKILAAGRTLDEISPMDVEVTSEDMSRALDKLNRASGDYADKFLGDNDGQVEAGEGNTLRQFTTENPGFRKLQEMLGSYDSVGPKQVIASEESPIPQSIETEQPVASQESTGWENEHMESNALLRKVGGVNALEWRDSEVIKDLFDNAVFDKELTAEFPRSSADWNTYWRMWGSFDMKDLEDGNSSVILEGKTIEGDTVKNVQALVKQLNDHYRATVPQIDSIYERAQAEHWSVDDYVKTVTGRTEKFFTTPAADRR